MIEITTVMTFVNPVLASEFLARNGANRPIREAWVKTLMKYLSDGTFYTTHQGIAFDVDGRLIDGQHRLTAIVRSGIGAWMNVTKAIPTASHAAVDAGIIRTLPHVAAFMGIEPSPKTWAVMRAVQMGPNWGGGRFPSKMDAIAFYLRYRPEIDEAVGILRLDQSKMGVGRAQIGAAAARMLLHHPMEQKRLQEFSDVLTTGFTTSLDPSDDSAAILLRNALILGPQGRKIGRISQGGTITYKKSARALQAFLARENLKVLRAVDEDIYPLTREV